MADRGDEALRALLDGNRRYVGKETVHPDRSEERRAALTGGQEPFATILGCSDSRVPAEIVFDQGLGDLFVVRTAGHVVDEAVLGTLEFGVSELGVPLIFVLGHERCGAVEVTNRAIDDPADAEGSTRSLIEAIMPALVRASNRPGDLLNNAVRANIEMTIERLEASPVIASALSQGKIKIAGGLYDLDTGLVEVTVR
ncbi:MAG: carbonic anhydrase [Actinomycetota bacterium]